MAFLRKATIVWDMSVLEPVENGPSIGQLIDAAIVKAMQDDKALHELTIGWETREDWDKFIQTVSREAREAYEVVSSFNADQANKRIEAERRGKR